MQSYSEQKAAELMMTGQNTVGALPAGSALQSLSMLEKWQNKLQQNKVNPLYKELVENEMKFLNAGADALKDPRIQAKVGLPTLSNAMQLASLFQSLYAQKEFEQIMMPHIPKVAMDIKDAGNPGVARI